MAEWFGKLYLSQKKQDARSILAWEDWVYNLTRPVKSLCVEVNDGQRRWQQRSAMAAGLADHVWTIEELLMTFQFQSLTTQNR
jgi:hypothetical protein